MTFRHLVVGAVFMTTAAVAAAVPTPPEPGPLTPCTEGSNYTCEDLFVPGAGRSMLDATLYRPTDRVAAPAVIYTSDFACAHRDPQHYEIQRTLAEAGFVVLAVTPRGFGRSGYPGHFASPDHEVNDLRKLIDWLADLEGPVDGAVQLDAAGNPRVGLTGISYGGSISVLTAAVDERVDALAVQDVWYDLRSVFAPNGVVKSAHLGGTASAGVGGGIFGGCRGVGQAPGPGGMDADFHLMVAGLLATGDDVAPPGGFRDGSPSAYAYLERRSPASVAADGLRLVDRISAPTLLFGGQRDTLVFASNAVALAAGIAAHPQPAPVRLVLYSQDHGHNYLKEELDEVDRMRITWFDRYLRGPGRGAPESDVLVWRSWIRDADGGETANFAMLSGLPRVTTDAGLVPAGATIVNPSPADREPVTSADFAAAGLRTPVVIAGVPELRFTLTTTAREAVLLASLHHVGDQGYSTRLGELLTPVRVRGGKGDFCSGDPQPGPETGRPLGTVAVCLPLAAVATRVRPDERLVLRIATREPDQRYGYASSREPATYNIAHVTLRVPAISEDMLRKYAGR